MIKLDLLRHVTKLSMCAIALASITNVATGQSDADDVRGFIEPYSRSDVSAAEMGMLSQLHVVEGQQVRRGDVLGSLDDRVLQSSLAIADAARTSRGTLDAAKIDAKMKSKQRRGYEDLLRNGNASTREVERIEVEHEQAIARVQAAQEQLHLRELEHARTLQQIEQRRIHAPFDGVVVKIVKHVGEFVSPTEPVVLELIQIDTLKCSLTIPYLKAREIELGQTVALSVGRDAIAAQGVVEFVSPIIDPQSGTVRIHLRVPNDDAKLTAGLVCRMNLNAAPVTSLRTARRDQ